MGIKVVASPTKLTWNDFRPVGSLPEPHNPDDIAQTATNMDPLSGIRPVPADGAYSLPALTLHVRLDRAQTIVVRKANKTQDVLKHEQGHFDITVLTVRAMAAEMEQLKADSPQSLGQQLGQIVDEHQRRADALTEKYDHDTRGSINQKAQESWNNEIDAAMRSSRASTLKGLPL